MLSRKQQHTSGSPLPEYWIEKVTQLLMSTYQTECDKHKKTFEVHGITYSDELWVSFSFLDPKNEAAIPTTYIISLDLKNNEKPTKQLDAVIDSAGHFFETYFSDPNWSDYQSNWEEANFKGINFFYKVTRENIALTILANDLLSEDSE